MAKKLKTVVQEMNGKVLTNREASRKAQDERRKAERRLARLLSEDLGAGKVDRKSAYSLSANYTANEQVRSLRGTIESLTSKPLSGKKQRTGYTVSIQETRENINYYTESKYGTKDFASLSKQNTLTNGTQKKKRKSDKLFMHQMNQATKKNGLSTLKSKDVHAFYAATKFIWESATNPKDRNKEIKKFFGTNDIEKVYNLLINGDVTNKRFYNKVKGIFEEKEIDLDEFLSTIQDARDQNGDSPDVKYSPLEVANIILSINLLVGNEEA